MSDSGRAALCPPHEPSTTYRSHQGTGGRHALGHWDRTWLLDTFLRPDSGGAELAWARGGLRCPPFKCPGQTCSPWPRRLGDLGAGGWRCSSFHQGALPAQLHPQAPQEWGPGFPRAALGLSTEVGDTWVFSPGRQSLNATETSPFVLSLAISLVRCCLQPQPSATMRKTQEVKTPCPGWWS